MPDKTEKNLAFAFAASTASGATFLGLPGLTYSYGMSTLWIAFCYPIGVYIGVMICQRTIGRYGNEAGARSIPEFLGERFNSEGLRLSAAIFSLILLFYLASQLVAGLIMFEMMLGLSQLWALVITSIVLLGYVTLPTKPNASERLRRPVSPTANGHAVSVATPPHSTRKRCSPYS